MRRHPPSYVPATLMGQITHPLASEVLRSSEASFGIPLMLVHSSAAVHALCRYIILPGAQPTRVVSTMTFLKHKVTCRHTRSIAGHFYETLLRRGLAGARRGSPSRSLQVISCRFTSRSRVGLHPVVVVEGGISWTGPGREGEGCIHSAAARCLSTGSRRLGLAHVDLSIGAF